MWKERPMVEQAENSKLNTHTQCSNRQNIKYNIQHKRASLKCVCQSVKRSGLIDLFGFRNYSQSYWNVYNINCMLPAPNLTFSRALTRWQCNATRRTGNGK